MEFKGREGGMTTKVFREKRLLASDTVSVSVCDVPLSLSLSLVLPEIRPDRAAYFFPRRRLFRYLSLQHDQLNSCKKCSSLSVGAVLC